MKWIQWVSCDGRVRSNAHRLADDGRTVCGREVPAAARTIMHPIEPHRLDRCVSCVVVLETEPGAAHALKRMREPDGPGCSWVSICVCGELRGGKTESDARLAHVDHVHGVVFNELGLS